MQTIPIGQAYPVAPQPRGTIRTNEPHMPEPRTATMNHSDENPIEHKNPGAPDHSTQPQMDSNAQSNDENDATVLQICSCRSFDCIATVAYGFEGIKPQNIMPWIDPYEFGGGLWVRAACSNVAPSVWARADRDSVKNVGATRNTVKSWRLEEAVNPRKNRGLGVSASERVRRVRRRGRKGGG